MKETVKAPNLHSFHTNGGLKQEFLMLYKKCNL